MSTPVLTTAGALAILTAYFGSGTFYLHLVRSTPVAGVSTVAGLLLPTGGNYAPKTVAVSIGSDATGARVICPTPQNWQELLASAPTNTVGVALCRQSGASPASTDTVVLFHPFTGAVAVDGCTTTSGSPVVTTTNSFSAFLAGQAASGAGIPIGARILRVDSATQITLNTLATASGTVSLSVFTPVTYQIQSSTGDDFLFNIPANGLFQLS